jgi:hypothetical protein
MKAKQAYVSPCVANFKDRWFEMFGFIPYDNPNEPAVFFYNWVDYDLDLILKHKAKCVVVITSSHTVGIDIIAKELNKENIKVIASEKMGALLLQRGLKTEYAGALFVEKDKRVQPVTLGDKIYTYLPPARYVEYGGDLVEKLKTKYEVIVGKGPSMCTQKEWYGGICDQYYGRAFVGLNLARSFGGQVTITDLGLRGIPCITNIVNMPHTIPWKTLEDVEAAIEKAALDIGKVNTELAQKVYESMDYEQKWLEIDT